MNKLSYNMIIREKKTLQSLHSIEKEAKYCLIVLHRLRITEPRKHLPQQNMMAMAIPNSLSNYNVGQFHQQTDLYSFDSYYCSEPVDDICLATVFTQTLNNLNGSHLHGDKDLSHSLQFAQMTEDGLSPDIQEMIIDHECNTYSTPLQMLQPTSVLPLIIKQEPESDDDSASGAGLSLDIQDMIIDHEYIQHSPIHTQQPAKVSLIIKEECDSDNDSVMLEFDNLDFLDTATQLDNSDTVTSDVDEWSNGCYSKTTNLYKQKSDEGYYTDKDNNNDKPNGSTESPGLPVFDDICDDGVRKESDDEDDVCDKPYCKSNRGAKHILLWKFILNMLDNPKQKYVSWINIEEGTLKFVDTAAISKLWGNQKQKNDMNFEKLSRAIRHYYKSGLMSRVVSERLVYKFNWSKVPKKQRRVNLRSS